MSRPAPTDVPGRPRSLLPREHGAYGQLALPLCTALACVAPSLAGVCFATASVLAFLAHEPLLVALGQRGPRATREDGPRARRLLALLGGGALATGVAALLLAPNPARLAVAAPVLLGALLGLFIAKKQERTNAGEVVAGVALSSVGLPVALAGGQPLVDALVVWLLWSASFATATLAVRALIHSARSGRFPLGALLGCLLITSGAVAAAALYSAPLAPWAMLPGAIAALALLLVRIPPRNLRKVGWALVGVSLSTMVVIIAAFA